MKEKGKKGEFPLRGSETGSRPPAVPGLRGRPQKAKAPKAPASAYRILFDHGSDAIFLLADNIILDCNERAAYVFRSEKEKLCGRLVDELLPALQPDGTPSLEAFVARTDEVFSGKPQSFRWRWQPDGCVSFEAEVRLDAISPGVDRVLQVLIREGTKDRDAEEALKESENKFRDLSEKSLVGVYLIQDWVFKYVNPKLADIFGYTVEDLLSTIKPVDVVAPEDWPMVRDNIWKRISGETASIHSQFRLITRSGKVKNVEVYGSRTVCHGKPALVGTLLDITERKEREELLRQAERKYRSIFENAVEGIFQTTPDGQVVAANPAHAKMLGYNDPEELIASLHDVTHQVYAKKERRAEFMDLLDKEGLAIGFECEMVKKDGTLIWVSLNARRAIDEEGKTFFYEGTIEDITEKKRVENDLRLLNEFNKAIIDHAPVAIFTLDKDGIFTSINPALATLSGLGPRAGEKLIGFSWLENPYTIQCGLARYIEAGLRGEPFQLWDFPFMTYRGDRNIFMDFRGVPLKDKYGDIEGLLCIIEETTDRVKIRAKLMQEAKLSTIGRLAAGIAHELNNPLGTLVAYSERAHRCVDSFRGLRPTKGVEVEKLEGYLNIIEEEAFRCKRVGTDILSLFQREGLEIGPLNVNELLNGVADHMNIDRAAVRIVKDQSDCLPEIPGDVSALRQVFINLITNAMDAAEGRRDATIWIRTGLHEDRVLVEIEDNGTGIPESIVDKIFEPFFTTKESKSGIGLGLSLCHDFVRDLGGSIKVVSKPGHGTTFTVSLPIHNDDSREVRLR
ncbi:MAG TPA: PAS domain S-box protein [Syntrophorhabdaceae bacterium]|jgi:PAS domain S-box-containing protein